MKLIKNAAKNLGALVLAGVSALGIGGCTNDASEDEENYQSYNIGHAPVWETLPSQHILQGSAPGTIIYKDIKLKCSDPDDPSRHYPLEYYVMNSWEDDREVSFDGNDLVVTRLNKDFIGTSDIILRASDNHDPTGFHQSNTRLTLVVDSAYSREETNKNLNQHEGGIIRSWWHDDYSSASMEQTLLKMHDMGVESVTLMTTYYQDDKNSTSILPNEQKTPNEGGLEKAVKRAKELGFRTVLKPHVDLYDGDWRGHISFANEADWQAWFKSYENYILHMANFAEKNRIDMLVAGTELEGTCQRAEWYDIISKIREVYSGELTYSANWDNYRNAIFWPVLDFIGISEYYPISTNNNPTLAELEAASEARAQEFDIFSAETGKKLYITEIGFHCMDGTSVSPNQPTTGIEDIYEQANCYNARFKTMLNRASIKGMDVYGFYVPLSSNPDGFTVTGTLAEDIISYWYHYVD